jgi:hypothetical protein
MSDDKIIEFPKATTPEGTSTHSRWVGDDGEYITGRVMEVEKLRVELESIARRLLKVSKALD